MGVSSWPCRPECCVSYGEGPFKTQSRLSSLFSNGAGDGAQTSVTTLTSRALVLGLLSTGQSCKETESVGGVRAAELGGVKSTGVGRGGGG